MGKPRLGRASGLEPLVLSLLFAAGTSLASPDALADGGAETTSLPRLHRSADEMLRLVVPGFAAAASAGDAPAAAARLVGVYVALDANVTEATALAACDDDGDPVVVVTAALLELLDSVASTALADVGAPAGDGGTASRHAAARDVYPHLPRVEAYAALLAAERGGSALAQTTTASELSPVRPGTPPAGTFAAPAARGAASSSVKDDLYDAMIAAVVAIELAHLVDGDVVCASPTSTREAADDDWSPAEAAAARRHAEQRVLGGLVRERAIDATALAARAMERVNAPRDGALVLHRFLTALDRRGGSPGQPPALPYLASHAEPALALEVFRAAWRDASEAGDPKSPRSRRAGPPPR